MWLFSGFQCGKMPIWCSLDIIPSPSLPRPLLFAKRSWIMYLWQSSCDITASACTVQAATAELVQDSSAVWAKSSCDVWHRHRCFSCWALKIYLAMRQSVWIGVLYSRCLWKCIGNVCSGSTATTVLHAYNTLSATPVQDTTLSAQWPHGQNCILCRG